MVPTTDGGNSQNRCSTRGLWYFHGFLEASEGLLAVG